MRRRGPSARLDAEGLRRSFLKRLAIAVGVLVLFTMTVGAIAKADAPPNWTNPCSADLDVGTCERLTYIADEQARLDTEGEDTRHLVGWLVGVTLVTMFAGPFWRYFSGSPTL